MAQVDAEVLAAREKGEEARAGKNGMIFDTAIARTSRSSRAPVRKLAGRMM